jgi:CRP-like cAMP-binding protein
MRGKEDRQSAGASSLLAQLPDELADTILSRTRTHSFRRGATIFLQGEPAKHIYIVLDGWVKLARVSRNGTEAVIAVSQRGQSFGESACCSDVYPMAAEAVSDCRLASLRASLVLDLMDGHPEVRRAILWSVSDQFHRLVAQVEQLKVHTGSQRLAAFLLDLCPVKEGGCMVDLPYNKVLIAGRLGLKPESLSRAFSRLKEAGVNVKRDRAAIADVSRLRDYLEEGAHRALAPGVGNLAACPKRVL